MTWKGPMYVNLSSQVDNLHKGTVMGSFDVFFDVSLNELLTNSVVAAQMNCWTNSVFANNLKQHDVHVISL